MTSVDVDSGNLNRDCGCEDSDNFNSEAAADAAAAEGAEIQQLAADGGVLQSQSFSEADRNQTDEDSFGASSVNAAQQPNEGENVSAAVAENDTEAGFSSDSDNAAADAPETDTMSDDAANVESVEAAVNDEEVVSQEGNLDSAAPQALTQEDGTVDDKQNQC